MPLHIAEINRFTIGIHRAGERRLPERILQRQGGAGRSGFQPVNLPEAICYAAAEQMAGADLVGLPSVEHLRPDEVATTERRRSVSPLNRGLAVEQRQRCASSQLAIGPLSVIVSELPFFLLSLSRPKTSVF